MDPATTFLLSVLVLQAGFTGTLVWIVARRFPRRAALYRFVAPAAVPGLLFTIVTTAFLSARRQMGQRFALTDAEAVLRFFLAYFVLWLVGVIFAGMIVRWTRRG
jgi:hypothetical protein